MSIGNNRDEQALTRLIADSIVETEVMVPMSKIGWGHNTPPPPVYGQPVPPEGAPAPVAPAAAHVLDGPPAPAPSAQPTAPVAKADDLNQLLQSIEALRGPDGKIAGKYLDPVAALQGLGHLTQYAKAGFSQRDSLAAEVERLRSENLQLRTSPAATPAAAPAFTVRGSASRQDLEQAQASYDEVLSSIVESGGLLDGENAKALAVAQREVSRLESRAAVEEAFNSRSDAAAKDAEKWVKVDAFMQERYPESLQFSEEMGLHVKSNPLLQKAVAALAREGDEIAASELAWTEFSKVRTTMTGLAADAERVEIAGSAREQVRQEFVAAARRDAGVVTGSAGGTGVHEAPGITGPSREEISMAAEGMMREGVGLGSRSAEAWRAMVIGPSLDPSTFGS